MAISELICMTMNELLAKDKEAIENLIEYHLPCKEEVVTDPCLRSLWEMSGHCEIGLLEVLNILTMKEGKMLAMYYANGDLKEFLLIGREEIERALEELRKCQSKGVNNE